VDWSILQFLAPAIAASLIIAGIHAYLGLHVVERGVIFVDLSLAQINAQRLPSTLVYARIELPSAAIDRIEPSALPGWDADDKTVSQAFGDKWYDEQRSLALLVPSLGGDPHSPAVYWMSLGFTLIGAAIFSLIKGHEARIPQEAIIGISYAVASAAVILAMSQATGEAEHLRDMLVGNILSVQWPEVWRTAAIYVVISIFHLVFRKRFLEISVDPHGASARGVAVRFWDFLFYASFGIVVTRSVAIAGVLLVFCYLIVPSVGGMLFSSRIGPRLAIGWVMGTVVSMLGMYVSVLFDLPTGAAIVCTFGAALIVMAVMRPLVVRKAA